MDGVLIIRRPRAVIKPTVQAIPQNEINPDHLPLLNDILQKDEWTDSEAKFVCSIIKKHWCE